MPSGRKRYATRCGPAKKTAGCMHAHLSDTATRPDLVWSSFKHPSVPYSTDLVVTADQYRIDLGCYELLNEVRDCAHRQRPEIYN
jgi:hypothetical protein